MSTAVASRNVTCLHCGRRNRVPDSAVGAPRCGNCHEPLPWIVDASDGTFADVAERASVPVVVDLWAPWCGPCRMVSPVLAKVATDLAGRIKLVKVDIDDNPQIARRFEVQAVPTLLVLDHGRILSRQAGAAAEHILRKWVEEALADVKGGAG